MSTQNTIVAALAGLTAGVAIGVLTAPDKGSETRRKIADTAEDWRRRAMKLFGKGEYQMEELHKIFENEISGLKDDVRQRVLKLIEESKNTYDSLKQEALNSQ